MEYNEQNKQSWNTHSARYQRTSDLNFQQLDFGERRYPTNDELQLLGNVTGKRVLELGCGGGNVGIILAKQGALVTGVDISEEQITAAQHHAQQEGATTIDFTVSSIEDYAITRTYDVVISICAFQYVQDLRTVFRNVYHGLTAGGEFIFSTNHPAFFTAAFRSIWNDEIPDYHYQYEAPEVWKWEHTDTEEFITFPHPVEYYVNTLVDVGFSLERLHELQLDKDMTTCQDEEERLECIYPKYLVIKSKKSGQ